MKLREVEEAEDADRSGKEGVEPGDGRRSTTRASAMLSGTQTAASVRPARTSAPSHLRE